MGTNDSRCIRCDGHVIAQDQPQFLVPKLSGVPETLRCFYQYLPSYNFAYPQFGHFDVGELWSKNSSIFLTPRLVECDSACACWAMVIDSTWSRSRLTVQGVYGNQTVRLWLRASCLWPRDPIQPTFTWHATFHVKVPPFVCIGPISCIKSSCERGACLSAISVLPTHDSLISSSRLGPCSLNPVTHAASVGNSFLPPLLKVVYGAPRPGLSSSPSNSAKA
ncbi:hypothetical protein VNO77_19898 [Canavalia gladiata]|uniref:Uncharacterized protein n=1 Tax=Canavalia gladiata TaxID=3824 RepID=A0AAN9QKX5_CANGL